MPYSIYARLQSWGYDHKRVNHAEANSLETKMATVFVKSMCIPWKASGRSCGVGCARIGAYSKRNSHSTWVSSSLCTTSASEAKRCLVRSLSYSSHKTLESNKSVIAISTIYALMCEA